MSERDVRVHTHASNRATAISKDRKVTFKSTLDTPFRIPWPKISINVQTELLAHLISILEGVAEYHLALRRLSRKRKRGKARDEEEDGEEKEDVDSRSLPSESDTRVRSIIDHLVIGLNAVTKRLEEQVRKRPHSVTITEDQPTAEMQKTKRDLCLVLACRADVDPPLLIDHLPHLVASCNAMQKESVRIASLPEGAEGTLAKSLGIHRVTVIGLDAEFPVMDGFKHFFESIPILSAPWLSGIRQVRDFIPTHVKQVKTTAPRDMKEAKEERKKGRALAKQRKRIKIR
ncbi:hypothetical protein F5887DRAFT_1073154 [Amanita rubescens]|nr:hypothetical protein F5887DRAFT_1073154 [Amanita rubescens]